VQAHRCVHPRRMETSCEKIMGIQWTASAVASPNDEHYARWRIKPAFVKSCAGRSPLLRRGEGGAGGIRTLVQTTVPCAFFRLSRFIGFRPSPGKGHPSDGLGPVSYPCYGPPHEPVFQDDTPDPGRRMTGLPEGHSSTLLLFAWIKRNSLRLLSCESVVYVASYGVEALG